MRYINQQKHKYSCGPVAVLNALKWLGGRVGYQIIDMFTAFGYDATMGIYASDLQRSLMFFDINFKRYRNPSINDIERELNRGNGIILRYRWWHSKYSNEQTSCHYVFIDKNNKDFFRAYNLDDSRKLNKAELDKYFKLSKCTDKLFGDVLPDMWVISK